MTLNFYWSLFLLTILIMLLVLYYSYIRLQQSSPYLIINYYNDRISPIRNYQNSVDALDPSLPSYQNASLTKNLAARKLHELVSINHHQILKELNQVLEPFIQKKYKGPGSYQNYPGYPMIDLDPIQGKTFKGQDGWRPLWVKFLDHYAETASLFPTLKGIVMQIPEVSILHISIFWPGTELVKHKGISMGVLRYHYGLIIPSGDVGIEINGSNIKWQEAEGFVFDDSLPHRAWNHTNSLRAIIFADVYRDLGSPIENFLNRSIFKLIQSTKHIQEVQHKLHQPIQHNINHNLSTINDDFITKSNQPNKSSFNNFI